MERLRSLQSDNILGRTDDFYVRVCSGSLPAPNTHCRFMVYFPDSLRMAMDFEVSLHKIMYPRNWRTFPESMELWVSFRFDKDTDDELKGGESADGVMEVESNDDASLDPECEGGRWRRVKLPNGCYTNAKDVFDMIMCEMRTTKRGGKFLDIARNIEFQYLPTTDKVYIMSKRKGIQISLSADFARLIGFQKRKFTLSGDDSSTFKPGMHTYFLEELTILTDIVKPEYYCGAYSGVLDTIEIKSSREGVIATSYVPTRRIYKKLNSRRVPAIEIRITTTDGRPVMFDEHERGGGYTGVELDLHFRPVVFNEGE